MGKLKKVCLFLSIICFVIAGYRILYNLVDKNEEDMTNSKVNYEEKIETISKLDKIGINTKFKIINKYVLCNHIIEENIQIDKTLINKTYDDILKMYQEYTIESFNQKEIVIKREINEYCPYHYILREENNKINVYRQIDDNREELLEILNIDISMLRQVDRYMFKTTGIKIYGNDELYQLIEDYDS